MTLFAAITSFGVIVAIVGYITVFSALVLLFLIFNNIPKLYRLELRKKMRRKNKHKELADSDFAVDISGETSAAISTALHLFFSELHDDEDMVMTIKKVSKSYSPWSSKIYGLNNYNFRNQ